MAHFIFACYMGLICTALIVAGLSINVLINNARDKVFNNVFWFALAITVSWSGTLGIRIWFTIWKWLGDNGVDVEWMENHWGLSVLIFILISGGIMHIRTLTVSKYGESGWILTAALVALTVLFSYFL